jgi:hypothetical protein
MRGKRQGQSRYSKCANLLDLWVCASLDLLSFDCGKSEMTPGMENPEGQERTDYCRFFFRISRADALQFAKATGRAFCSLPVKSSNIR